MVKLFKLQKKIAMLFVFTIVITFIFCLGFMTDFAPLYGLEYGFNEHITEFHEGLQVFNKVLLVLGIVSLFGLLAIFMLQVNKKVCDKMALFIMYFFIALIIGTCIYGVINLISIYPVYKDLDVSRFYDEKSVEYVKSYGVFTIGYIVYGFALISSITTAVVLSLSHFKFVKLDVNKTNKLEVGVNNG